MGFDARESRCELDQVFATAAAAAAAAVCVASKFIVSKIPELVKG